MKSEINNAKVFRRDYGLYLLQLNQPYKHRLI